MAKRKTFSQVPYNRQHLRNLVAQGLRVRSLFEAAAQQAGIIGESTGFNDPDKEFHLSDYPAADARMNDAIKTLHDGLVNVIASGNATEWALSAVKNDELVKSLLNDPNALKTAGNGLFSRNLDALQAFQGRKVNGMNLSQRVWSYMEQTKQEFELALDLGLGTGRSADQLSRDIRRALKDPDNLFRRVRDKHGELRLSKAAAAYHPGRGVYRSSYKNALRLTATENNMAYRESDHLRWQQNPFVIGIEIKVSQTNHTEPDMCDTLQGQYPKDFKWTGWHPFCRCFATAITASEKERDKYWDAMANDEDVSNWEFNGTIKEMPENFTGWVDANEERIAKAKSMPYFIRDNFKDGDVAKGLRWENEVSRREQTLAAAEERHRARTKDEIDSIQEKWNRRLIESEGEGWMLERIERKIEENGLDRAQFDSFIKSKLPISRGAAYDYSKLSSLTDLYDAMAEEAWDNAYAVIKELYEIQIKTQELGAVGASYAKRIERHISQLEKMNNWVAYANSPIESKNLQSARSKYESIVKHRTSVKQQWNARRAKMFSAQLASMGNAGIEPLTKIEWTERWERDVKRINSYLGNKASAAFKARLLVARTELEYLDIMEEAISGMATGGKNAMTGTLANISLGRDEMRYSRAQRHMFAEIEKQFGLKRKYSMDILEADSQHANPNVGKRKGFGINCQTCAPAYALREMGFDITAKANTKGSLLEWLSEGRAFEVWKNPNGTKASYIKTKEWMASKGISAMTKSDYLQFFEECTKEVGTYELSIQWEDGGHATILKRLQDGTLLYIEPQRDNQTKNKWNDIEHLASKGWRTSHECRGIMRIDDKVFDLSFFKIFNR